MKILLCSVSSTFIGAAPALWQHSYIHTAVAASLGTFVYSILLSSRDSLGFGSGGLQPSSSTLVMKALWTWFPSVWLSSWMRTLMLLTGRLSPRPDSNRALPVSATISHHRWLGSWLTPSPRSGSPSVSSGACCDAVGSPFRHNGARHTTETRRHLSSGNLQSWISLHNLASTVCYFILLIINGTM